MLLNFMSKNPSVNISMNCTRFVVYSYYSSTGLTYVGSTSTTKKSCKRDIETITTFKAFPPRIACISCRVGCSNTRSSSPSWQHCHNAQFTQRWSSHLSSQTSIYTAASSSQLFHSATTYSLLLSRFQVWSLIIKCLTLLPDQETNTANSSCNPPFLPSKTVGKTP
jgi:hypothetical protein